jgi:hypothetical protein
MATRCSWPPLSCCGSRAPSPAQAHGVQHLRHARVVVHVQQHERQRHVLGHVQVRQHVEGLEHEADVLAPPQRAGVVAEGADVHAIQRDRALVPVVQRGHAVQQRRLADAGFAHDGDELTGRHAQRDVGKHRRVAVALGEVADNEAHGRARCATS